jgi:tRNA-2-methylthio-N6-dimethylallyladenosine synthase
MRFAGGFVFKYSPRPGTLAARRYPDDVPRKEKERRHRELLDLISEIAMQDNQALIGREVMVLVEGPAPRPHLDGGPERKMEKGWKQWRGRTPCHRLVVFDGPPNLAGELVTVRIERAGPITLFAALPENGS